MALRGRGFNTGARPWKTTRPPRSQGHSLRC
jgi:hypothetical protein